MAQSKSAPRSRPLILWGIAAATLLAYGVSLRHIFLLAIVPALIVLALAVTVPEPQQPVTLGKDLRWTFSGLPPAFRRYLIVLTLFTLGNSSNMFLLLRANELGASATRVTLMWALYSFTAALLSRRYAATSAPVGDDLLRDRWARELQGSAFV